MTKPTKEHIHREKDIYIRIRLEPMIPVVARQRTTRPIAARPLCSSSPSCLGSTLFESRPGYQLPHPINFFVFLSLSGSLVVRADVCFVTASQTWRRKSRKLCFVSSWGRALPTSMKTFTKRLVTILYHMLKCFGGTKTS
jgi:hypothetical protein